MKITHALIVAIFLAVLIFSAGCEQEKPATSDTFEVTDISHTDCKSDDLSHTKRAVKNQLIIYKAVNNSLLFVKHVNGVFNCCPKGFTVVAVNEGNELIVTENENELGCKCICEFDLKYKIGPLKKNQKYTFILKQGNPAQEITRFTFIYDESLVGKHMIR